MKTIAIVFGALFILFIVCVIAGNSPSVAAQTNAEDSVRQMFKSPSSVEFTFVRVSADSSTVCGYASGVNSFNVRLAPVMFYANVHEGKVYIDEEEITHNIVSNGCKGLLD